jgi:hypothetical protein
MGLDMYLFRNENGRNVEVGYWRKANAIHNWFVQNCQKGIDECQEARVSVNKVLAAAKNGDFSLAEDMLPTQSGFFFGGTDYDEYYIQDLESTLEILDKAIAANKPCIYQSSW